MALYSLPVKPTHLEPSPLGTKEYWDTLYTTELSNHASDPSDVGTIWFDDSAAEDKVVEYLRGAELGLNRETTSFLDIGTGNGHFLLRLREGEDDDDNEDEDEEEEHWHEDRNVGFRGRMMGTDYSDKSIEFAKRLAASKDLGPGSDGEIEFVLSDLMSDEPVRLGILGQDNREGWDVVLDKGTFDAISLSAEVDERGRRIGEGYKERVLPLVKVGGNFVVTSCNWTEKELDSWFAGGEGNEGGFEKVGSVAYRSFRFGGVEGQTISTVCFKKVRKL